LLILYGILLGLAVRKAASRLSLSTTDAARERAIVIVL